MSHLPQTASERTLFQLVYVLPWSTVCIIAILLLWKPDELKYHLQTKADYMGVDIRTLIVYSILAVVGVIVLVYIGYQLLDYIRQPKVDESEARSIYEQEREALVAIFEEMDGKNWYNKIRWCSDEPIERWHGVKLDPVTHRVNKLILPENRLGGKIPEAIGNLKALIEIDFRRNEIGGCIPNTMLSLSNLQGLYLFENRLEGEIPMKLCELPRLSGIYLFNNNFTNYEEARTIFRSKLPEECHVFI